MSRWIAFKCNDCGTLSAGMKAKDGFKKLSNNYAIALGLWLYEHADCVTQDKEFVTLITEDDPEFGESPIYWDKKYLGDIENAE